MDYRPGTPDDLPIIGEDPDVRGLVYATGHFRNGILLAPAVAMVGGAPAATVTVTADARFHSFNQVRYVAAPGETNNLYHDAQARATRDDLQSRLTAWQQSIDDPILTNPYNTPSVGGSVDAR